MNKKLYTILGYFLAILIIFVTVQLAGLFAVNSHLTDVSGFEDQDSECFRIKKCKDIKWSKTKEWETLKQAIIKDKEKIIEASQKAGVSPRLIASFLFVEQMRLYFDNRELFEKVFYPLKMLVSQNQFSLGVTGLKQETAKMIEDNLHSTSSVFYLGEKYRHLLDFDSDNHDKERFERISDEKNHYYAYLYSGLYASQVMSQWKKAGFDISDRPEIIATLYNVGFNNSKPKENPFAGGSEINIEGNKYTFGGLAYQFYMSDELLEILPR